MKGTEKQMAWAQEIIDRLENNLAEQIEAGRKSGVPEEKINSVARVWNNIFAEAKQAHAGNVIEIWKNKDGIPGAAAGLKISKPMYNDPHWEEMQRILQAR